MGYTIMSWVVTVITCGALRLIFYWWPTLMLFSTHMKCSLQSAEKILVVVWFICFLLMHQLAIPTFLQYFIFSL